MSSSALEPHAALWDAVKAYWEPNAVLGHGPDHAQRAYLLAERLSKGEGANFLTAGAGCYLMDAGIETGAGRESHVERSVRIGRRILPTIPALASLVEPIVECVERHEAESDLPPGTSLEALVVRDADTLDRLGFDGIRMTLIYGLWCGRPLFQPEGDPTSRESTYAYISYLGSLSDRVTTRTAKGDLPARELERRTFARELLELKTTGRVTHRDALELLDRLQRGFSS